MPKILSTALLAALLAASPAAAQLQADKTYTLTLTGQDVATIAQVLNEAPYKLAQPILEKLSAQTKPKDEPKPDK